MTLARDPDGSPTRGFWSHSAVLVTATGVSAVLSALYVALSGRLLGPERYGAVAASLSLGSLLAFFFGPFETGVTKFAADYHARSDHGRLGTLAFGTFRRLILPVSAGAVVLLAASPWIRQALRFHSFGELFALTIYSALSFLICLPRGVQRGDHRFFDYGVNQVAESAVRLVAGGAFVLLGLGAGGAVGGYAVGMAAALAFAFWQLRDLRAQPRRALDTAGVYAFSAPLFFVYFYFLFTVNIDVLVAKRFLPAAEVGVYGGCSAITRIVNVAAGPVYQVLFSRIAALRARGSPTRALAASATAVVAVGLALGYAIPWFFGAEVLSLLFGRPYATGAGVLRVQWITTSLLIAQGMGAFVLLAEERTRQLWLLVLPCVVLTALLWRFHGNAIEVARDCLIGSLVGSGVLVYLVSRRAAPSKPGAGVESPPPPPISKDP
jgi:O-antigen/teichoic acid export membrane protein